MPERGDIRSLGHDSDNSVYFDHTSIRREGGNVWVRIILVSDPAKVTKGVHSTDYETQLDCPGRRYAFKSQTLYDEHRVVLLAHRFDPIQFLDVASSPIALDTHRVLCDPAIADGKPVVKDYKADAASVFAALLSGEDQDPSHKAD